MARGPKHHLKRLNAPKHWMLDKLGGTWVSRSSLHPVQHCYHVQCIRRAHNWWELAAPTAKEANAHCRAHLASNIELCYVSVPSSPITRVSVTLRRNCLVSPFVRYLDRVLPFVVLRYVHLAICSSAACCLPLSCDPHTVSHILLFHPLFVSCSVSRLLVLPRVPTSSESLSPSPSSSATVSATPLTRREVMIIVMRRQVHVDGPRSAPTSTTRPASRT